MPTCQVGNLSGPFFIFANMTANLFHTYFQLGYQHILDPAGYDHMAFLLALCAIYPPEQWKRVAWLATAFTLGHSLTLALAGFNILQLPGALIEWIIPITIILAAVWNVIPRKGDLPPFRQAFILTGTFGLVHGLGFSNFLRSSLFPGQEAQIVPQLFSFNVGIECGQLFILFGIWIIAIFAFRIGQVPQKNWNLFISGLAAGIAITLLLP